MKKIMAITMILVMILSLLTACGKNDTANTTPPASSDKQEPSDSSDTPETSDSSGKPESSDSSDKQETSDSSETPETSTSSETPETSTSTNEDPPIEMGELAIVLGGDALTLPISVEDLMALGWEPSGEKTAANLEETLNPKEYTTIYLEKGDYSAPSLVANLTDDAIITNQGTIVGFDEVRYYNELELPNGIVQHVSTMEDIAAAYGEPNEVDSWGKWTRYNIEGFAITVWEYEESGLIGLVNIRFQSWEDFDWVKL